MIRRAERRAAAALLGLLVAAAVPADASVVLTGEVHSADAEPIYAPPSNSWPVVLRYYVPEGTAVQPGDLLVRIDPGESLSQVDSLQAQLEQAAARAAKEVAELQVRRVDAERAELDAGLALAKARIDAAIPREHLSALDADRYHGELERAEREFALKRQERQAAEQAVQRRLEDAELEAGKLRADLSYHQAQVATAEQRATHAGVVVHDFDSGQGRRFDEGSSTRPGARIGAVVGDDAMEVRAWAAEPDRAVLQIGMPVVLRFDALPDARVEGRIERIAGAPEPKAEWGAGRWFTLDVSLATHTLPLLPGMSVQVAIEPEEAHR